MTQHIFGTLRLCVISAGLLSAATASSFAQAPTPAVPKSPPEVVQKEPVDQKACSQHPLTLNTDGTPQAPGTNGSGAPLSDKLAKSDGVICPPAGIDSEIKAPTPQGGAMPVIPPPGSPGGDPAVRPK